MTTTTTTKMHALSDDSWVLQGDVLEGLDPVDFDVLWDTHPAELGKVMMFDRIVSTPRWTQSYGRRYWYSGMMHEAEPVPELLKPMLAWANALPCSIEHGFDQVLVNWYEDGAHYIGPHSDNEAQLRTSSPIVSVSLGAERVFRVRDKADKKIVLDVAVKDRTYVVMGGMMQQRFTHEVTKTRKECGRRINVTFRMFV